MIPGFLKQDGDRVLFNDDGEMIYYIPEKYFNGKNAVLNGEYMDVMGIFNYDVFYSNGKHMGLKLFSFPTMIRCKPTLITKESSLQLEGMDAPEAFRLLHFSKGAEAICSTKVIKTVANADQFTNLLLRGNLPQNIPYDKLHEYITENARLNGFGYGLSAQMFGIVVSELCRDPKDLSRPFRLSDMKNMTDYKMVSISELPKYISPYTSITSENADESIAGAITNKSKTSSPLEKVMMN